MLPLQSINLPWDYSNYSVRSKACGPLNLECFFSGWIPWCCQCQERLQVCSALLARHWGEYLHPKALKLKNGVRHSWPWRTAAPVIIRKLHWINKTSNNCHKQMLKAGSLGKWKQILPTVCWPKSSKSIICHEYSWAKSTIRRSWVTSGSSYSGMLPFTIETVTPNHIPWDVCMWDGTTIQLLCKLRPIERFVFSLCHSCRCQ